VISIASGDLLSNFGWVDHGRIWSYDHSRRDVRMIEISEADWLDISRGNSSETFVAAYSLGGRYILEAHNADSSGGIVASVEVAGERALFSGDRAAFEGNTLFLYRLRNGAMPYGLVEIGPKGVSARPIPWFTDREYDTMYQSVTSVLELPTGELLFGSQRGSALVLCDPIDLRPIRRVPLADRGGNHAPFLRSGGTEVWAVDYDTVVRLDTDTLTVQDTWYGQPATDGTRMFLGDVWCADDRSPLLIARPGSGDVVMIDTDSLRIRQAWRTGRQPFTAALVDGELIARDWKTGDLLRSTDGESQALRLAGRRGHRRVEATK
jgi:hypothetical protein